MASVAVEKEIKYNEEMRKFEGVSNIPYVTSFERIGYKKGKEEGLQEDIEKGMKREMAKKLLEKGFSPEEISEITRLSDEDIRKISDR